MPLPDLTFLARSPRGPARRENPRYHSLMPPEFLYRTMKACENGLPVCAQNAHGLGVRVPPNKVVDITPDAYGLVNPSDGGMSVVPDDPSKIPPTRLPKERSGLVQGSILLFRTLSGVGGGLLRYRPDPEKEDDHGFLEPAQRMLLQDYREALCASKPEWEVVRWPPMQPTNT